MKRATSIFLFLYLIIIAAAQAQQATDRGKVIHTWPAGKADQLTLDHKWQFYWQQLLTTTNGNTIKPDGEILLKQEWKDFKLNGKSLPNQGYASYSTTIIIPPRLKNFAALYVPHFYSSYKIFANGQMVAMDGNTGKDKASAYPHWSTKMIPLFNTADTIELVIQVSNFTHAKSGSSKNILIGHYGQMVKIYRQAMMNDFIIAGCLLMGFFFFLGLYFFNQQEKAILFFALFCLAYTYRAMGFLCIA
jgi:two-component system, sensor histidine kinase